MNITKRCICGASMLAILAGPALAQVNRYNTTDKSGTITTGGVAQTAIAANIYRKVWCVQNPSTASEVLYVRLSGTASASTGTVLQAGQQACNQADSIDTGAVSVFAATTSHAFLAWEGE